MRASASGVVVSGHKFQGSYDVLICSNEVLMENWFRCNDVSRAGR